MRHRRDGHRRCRTRRCDAAEGLRRACCWRPSAASKWDTTDPAKPRPEQGLLGIRKALGLYTNLRPVQIFAALADASTLKPEIVDGVDMMIVRELTGGLYFGRRERFYDEEGCGMDGAAGQRAYDTLEYREYEVERIARQAFEAARKRRNKVTSVDKANVLETSRMWREIVHRVHDEEYADVELEDLLVDNTAMQLINRPADFDVVVTENMFGDILSDEAAQITGSLGMLASASLGDGTALYEPSHGSAPDIAGQGIANPLAQILSVEMMLRYSFDMQDAADDVRPRRDRRPRRGLAHRRHQGPPTPRPTRWSAPWPWATSWWSACRKKAARRIGRSGGTAGTDRAGPDLAADRAPFSVMRVGCFVGCFT